MEKFAILNSSSESNDDEIFIGNKELSKEIKRHVLLGRRTMSVVTLSDESEDSSIELIEAQSEPELVQTTLSPEKPARAPARRSLSQPDLRDSFIPQTWESKVTDDSFLAMESLVANAASNSDDLTKWENLHSLDKGKSLSKSTEHLKNNLQNKFTTPDKPDNSKKKLCASVKTVESNFKTPVAPNRVQKVQKSGQKITPLRSPANRPSPFKNIESPIAFYIRHSPQASLMRTIKPRRPLPGLSAIPKPIETQYKANKENITCNFPAKAYVGAKKTKLIVTPDMKQLPKNKQVREMASSIPHPTIIKHKRREKLAGQTSALRPAPDESFAKLSISQADLSVCVVKTATITESLKRK